MKPNWIRTSNHERGISPREKVECPAPWRVKTPSVPSDPSQALLAGVTLALEQAGREATDATRVLHAYAEFMCTGIEPVTAPTGVSSEALRTIEQPEDNAPPTFLAGEFIGKFHGEDAATHHQVRPAHSAHTAAMNAEHVEKTHDAPASAEVAVGPKICLYWGRDGRCVAG